MPAYNAARFIRSAVESVLAQEGADFELLACDDGSRDRTWDILSEWKDDPRVRLFKNRRNMGAAAARNRLLRAARGRYVSPCDADDLMLPGNLRVLSRALDADPAVGAVYADILVLETDKRQRLIRAPYVLDKAFEPGLDLCENRVNHGGSMIRRGLMLRVGGYDEDVSSGEDWSLWLKLAEITRFKYLRGELRYLYRLNPWGLTGAKRKSAAHMRRWLRTMEDIVGRAVRRRFGVEFRF
jgi:glycosyltransferase involved in cell wall biosynthesis